MCGKIKIAVTGFLLGIAPSSPALAEGNVQGLLESCISTTAPDGPPYCVGRVTGIFKIMALNGIAVTQHDGGAKFLAICAKDSLPLPSYAAQVQVFINWANKHPENWAMSDSEGVIRAMQEKWPCQ